MQKRPIQGTNVINPRIVQFSIDRVPVHHILQMYRMRVEGAEILSLQKQDRQVESQVSTIEISLPYLTNLTYSKQSPRSILRMPHPYIS